MPAFDPNAPTVNGPLPSGVPTASADRAPVAVLSDAPADAAAELNRLLASRLRQAFVLFLFGYILFVVRDLLAPDQSWVRVQLKLLLTAAVLQLGLIAVSRARAFAAPRVRRGLEWANLGLYAATAGGAQFAALNDPAYVDRFLSGGADTQVLVATTWMMPWFAVIAGYPTLVPNPWRRTAGLVAGTALVPPLVSAAAMASNPSLSADKVGFLFVQFGIWGSVGVWIAVYGAKQVTRLRTEAFEARQFGQYVLTRLLGVGGMGEVHLAEHRLLKRPSVIKLIRPEKARDATTIKRFEREVRLLATLTHWNTVEVYDYGHTPDGTFYFVMEYLPGLTLTDLVAQAGPLPPGRVAYIGRQVCAGLREAHAAGLIHRDIKPDNIMSCRRGGLTDVVKVLDFGLVQAPQDADGRLTGENTFLGTPMYVSPEQAGGTPADGRSDIYAVGCTLYFLLTGRPPFERTGVVALLAAHLLETPPPPAGVPDDLAAVVLRCLEKRPDARYPDVRELERALAGCACFGEWDEDRAAEWWRGQ